MPISKRPSKGIATRVCENTSGGVIIAATINITTIECLLYFIKNAGVIRPIFVRTKVIRGSSKTFQSGERAVITGAVITII